MYLIGVRGGQKPTFDIIYSNMTTRLSGHFLYLVWFFFVLKSLLAIATQWSSEKFAILTLKPRSHVKILIYRTWAIRNNQKECYN